MTEPGPQPRRPTLDELLDRPEGAAVLQRVAGANAEVRRHVDMQKRLDESLSRLFAEPDSVPIQLPAARRLSMPRWMPWAAAAALLIAAVGVYWVMFRGGKDVLAPLYQQTVAAGFKPEKVCTTDDEFASWCRAYMRQAVYPTSHPEGVEFVGWNLDQTIGPQTGVLLAKVDGQPVIVVMNRTDRQNVRPSLAPNGCLNVFRKRVGDLVLFEVTPEKASKILPVLSADKPKPSR